MTDYSARFTDKGKRYEEVRAGYPFDSQKVMFEALGLDGQSSTEKVILDVATGTGFLLDQFAGIAQVIAIDPGETMRKVAKEKLESRKFEVNEYRKEKTPSDYELYRENILKSKVVDGKSDVTGVADRSVDIIISGTAPHWFNPETTIPEFNRILKPGGKVAFIFNFFDKKDPFTERMSDAYEKTFPQVNWTRVGLYDTKTIADKYMKSDGMRCSEFSFTYTVNNKRMLDLLKTQSGPSEFTPEQEKIFTDIFDEYKTKRGANSIGDKEEEDVVHILYKTTLFVGRLLPVERQKVL